MQRTDSKANAKAQSKSTNKKDEFSKLKILALELKNMQLQLLKDLNKGDSYKANLNARAANVECQGKIKTI